jgi:hypothetical protein
MGIFAYSHALPRGEIIFLLLTSVLAAIQVGSPATFTLAAALGARHFGRVSGRPYVIAVSLDYLTPFEEVASASPGGLCGIADRKEDIQCAVILRSIRRIGQIQGTPQPRLRHKILPLIPADEI